MHPLDVKFAKDQNSGNENYPHLLKAPHRSSHSSTLDDIFQNLKAQRKEIESWKQKHNLGVLTPLTQNPSKESHSDFQEEDLRHEVERLKGIIKRYQQADPTLDFVHKDVLKEKDDSLQWMEKERRILLQERDKFLKDLETIKWHNANLASQRDQVMKDILVREADIVELKDCIHDKTKECEQHMREVETLKAKFEEFSRRHQRMDCHLMEIGEQKTSFLDGICEKQSQLDFTLAQLQHAQEKVKEEIEQRELMRQKKKEVEDQLRDLTATLEKTRVALEQTEDLVKKTQEHRKKTEEKLNVLRNRYENAISELEQKKTECQQAKNNISAANEKVKELTQKLKKLATDRQVVKDTQDIGKSPSGIVGEHPVKVRHKEYNRRQSDRRVEITEMLRCEKEQLQRKLEEMKALASKRELEINAYGGQIAELKAKIQEFEEIQKKEHQERDRLLTEQKKNLNQIAQLQAQIQEYEERVKQKDEEIRNITQELDKESRLKRIAQTGLRVSEQKFRNRRRCIGWNPTVIPKKEIAALQTGILVYQLYKKLSPQSVLFHKASYGVLSHFIQLNPEATALTIFKDARPATSKSKVECVVAFQNVISTEYGYTMASPLWREASEKTKFPLQQDGTPIYWRCFSIHTNNRSFDFLCNTDQDAEILVLGVGFGVTQGVAIRSRSEFLYRRVKIKLQEHCRRREITLKQLFLEAIHRSVALTPGLAPQGLQKTMSMSNKFLSSFAAKGVSKKKTRPSRV